MTLARALGAFERIEALEAPCTTQRIETGLLNQTHAVEDAAGRAFILQRLNPVFDRGINDNIVSVTEHLTTHGVTTFRIIPHAGRPVLDLGEAGLWRLLSRIPGTSFDRPQNTAQVLEAGRTLAAFHRALFDFDAPLQPLGFPFHQTRQHFEDLALALRECPDHDFHNDISHLAEDIFAAASHLQLFDDMPLRVIHGDPKFSNLLFETADPLTKPRTTGIIDLDTVARMPLAYDWGDATRSWCNRRAEDDPRAELDLDFAAAASQGLVQAFEAGPDLREIDSLCRSLEVVTLELCARFATDTLRECYFGWDANRYERAGAHHRNRARAQYALYLQACDTRDERARAIQGA